MALRLRISILYTVVACVDLQPPDYRKRDTVYDITSDSSLRK